MSEGVAFLCRALLRECPECPECGDLLALAVYFNGYAYERGWACSECGVLVDVAPAALRSSRSHAEWDLMLAYLAAFIDAPRTRPPSRTHLRQRVRNLSRHRVRKYRRP